MDDLKGYVEDAEPHDENDPEYEQELFVICKQRGWKPEDLMDKVFAKKYDAWLQKQSAK